MATPDAIGTSTCGNCGRDVYVRINRAGMAYARCEHCSFEGRFHNLRHSEAFVKSRVSLENPEPVTQKPAGKKPEIPAPQPAAAAPVAPEKPAGKTPEKPAKSGGGIWDGLMGGVK